MFVRLYIAVGGHICDFKHHILMHTVLSVHTEHTTENTILSTLVNALADTGSYNSSLGTLKLWVFSAFTHQFELGQCWALGEKC